MIKNLKKFLSEFYSEDKNRQALADKAMATLTISQLDKLIDLELLGGKRKSVLTRLHRRYTRLRADKERDDLLNHKSNWRHK